MWSMVTHLMAFAGGAFAGIMLLCLLQAGKRGDEWRENMEWRNNG